ncbi:MAG: hypothetical protein RJA99_1669 [Pseudomonadota bacterium]|jgi:hypothetical protein
MKEARFGMKPAARSVSDLLALDGEAFVSTAYIAILGRRPDPEGLAHYLANMRAGMAKGDVILALASSEEGLRGVSELPGLDELVASGRRRRSSLLRRGLGRLGSALVGDRLDTALRALDWKVADRLAEHDRTVKALVEGIGTRTHTELDAKLARIEAATAELERQADALERVQADVAAALRALVDRPASRTDDGENPLGQFATTTPDVDEDTVRRLRIRLGNV